MQLLVEMLAPWKGRVFDPCCGSGGMFVQSVEFVKAHATGNGNGGKAKGDLSIFGQESNATTWRLAKMNLAIRGIEGDLGEEPADSFHRDLHKNLKADYILANPPFNMSDWGGERVRDDVRWKFGAPPAGNANYAWVQHFIHHLAPAGVAGFVLANGSMSSNQSGEGEIRQAILRLTWWIAWWRCRGSSFTRRRFRCAYGFWRGTRGAGDGESAVAKRCLLMRGSWGAWWTGCTGS